MRPRDAGEMLAQLLEAERLMGITPTDRRGADTQAVTPLPVAEPATALLFDEAVTGHTSVIEGSPAELEQSDDDDAVAAAEAGRKRGVRHNAGNIGGSRDFVRLPGHHTERRKMAVRLTVGRSDRKARGHGGLERMLSPM